MEITRPILSERIIAFADLRGYHRHICPGLGPSEIFDFLSEFYAVAQSVLDHSNGQIVKFIGDSILCSFPTTNPHDSIDTLKRLKTETDLFLSRGGHESCLCIKAHLGPVATGLMGQGNLRREDICGLAVNQTALLPGGEWVLSAELVEKLGA